MKRVRIHTTREYIGCIPDVVYWVQVWEKSFWGGRWVKVKGFTDYKKAKELYEALK